MINAHDCGATSESTPPRTCLSKVRGPSLARGAAARVRNMAMSIGSGDERLDLAFSDTHRGSLERVSHIAAEPRGMIQG